MSSSSSNKINFLDSKNNNKNLNITIPIHKRDQTKYSVRSKIINGSIFPPIWKKIDIEQLIILENYKYASFNSGDINDIIDSKKTMFELRRISDEKIFAKGSVKETGDGTIQIFDSNKEILFTTKWPSKIFYLISTSPINTIPSIKMVGYEPFDKSNIDKDYVRLVYFEQDTLYAKPQYIAMLNESKKILTIIPGYLVKNKTSINYENINNIVISTRVGQKKKDRKETMEYTYNQYSSKSNVVSRSASVKSISPVYKNTTNTTKSIKLIKGPYNLKSNSLTLIKGNGIDKVPYKIKYYLMPFDDCNPSPWLWLSSDYLKKQLSTIFDGNMQLTLINEKSGSNIMGSGRLVDESTLDGLYLVRFPKIDAIHINVKAGSTSNNKIDRILINEYKYTIKNYRHSKSSIVIVRNIKIGDRITSSNNLIKIGNYIPGPNESKRNDYKSIETTLDSKQTLTFTIQIETKY